MTLESWAISELSRFGCPNPDDILTYLLEIEEEPAMEEYLCAMLDVTNSEEHKIFMREFLNRYNAMKSFGSGYYRKPNNEEIPINKGDFHKAKNKEKNVISESKSNIHPSSKISESKPNIHPLPKKKNKFVSLYSEEGLNKDVILIPGRQRCDCQASKHKLINNCLKCGRIVCEQEGSGPCAFCHTLVMSKEEEEFINRGTKKSEALHNKLINSKKVLKEDTSITSKGLQKAINHKNKLLEFDRVSEKRTKVYDDESDYFQSNSKWINPADRDKLQKYEEDLKKKKYDRNNKKYTVDLLGRKVLSEQERNIYDPEDPILQEIFKEGKAEIYSYGENEEIFQSLNVSRPVYVDTNDIISKHKPEKIISRGMHRLQDKELQEMRDEGLCLSMHQPWASLLVAGIKKHEGRTWYHSHRGRLWIASAAKSPTPPEVSQLEQTYRVLLDDETLKFPQNYPVSCLLGCVEVADILPQEEYRRQYPDGESDSPYVFVCEHPLEMIIKFPIKGQHKIYKLDSKIHQAALKSLKMT